MNKNNPIVKLVNEGMKMEKSGKINFARNLYMKAWNSASNNQEKCITAHFVARQQNSPKNALKWNIKSINYANKTKKEVKGYYPSLFLNIGISYENLGKITEANKYYELAFEKISDLPESKESKKYNQEIRKNILNNIKMRNEK